MSDQHRLSPLAAALAVALAAPAFGADIIAEWATAKAPPVPELKPVSLDGKTKIGRAHV